MIKEISLPANARESRHRAFKIANYFRERSFSIDCDQCVQMIRHQQHQLQIPAAVIVIEFSGFENLVRNMSSAKLVLSSGFAADCDKISRSETPLEMR